MNLRKFKQKWVLFTCIPLGMLLFLNHTSNVPEYSPILVQRSVLESSIELQDSRKLKDPGKIYFKDDYIFISERYKGIHIIDNRDSLNPEKIGFIKVPGGIDLAIKKNVLYVDNAVDLVAIKLKNNYQEIEVVKRIKNVFPEHTPPGYDRVPEEFNRENRPDNSVIIAWEKNTDD